MSTSTTIPTSDTTGEPLARVHHAPLPAAAPSIATDAAVQQRSNVNGDGLAPPPSGEPVLRQSGPPSSQQEPLQELALQLAQDPRLAGAIADAVADTVYQRLEDSGVVSFNVPQRHQHPRSPTSVMDPAPPPASLQQQQQQQRGVMVNDYSQEGGRSDFQPQVGSSENSVFRFRSYDEKQSFTPSNFREDDRVHITVPRVVEENLAKIAKRGRKDVRYDDEWAAPSRFSARNPRGGDLKHLKLLRECERLLYGLAVAQQHPEQWRDIVRAMHDWLFFSLHAATMELTVIESAQYKESAAVISRSLRSGNPAVIPERVAQMVASADNDARENQLIKLLSTLTSGNRGNGSNSSGNRSSSNTRGGHASSSPGRGSRTGGGGGQRRSQYGYGKDSDRRPNRSNGRGGASVASTADAAGDRSQ